MSKTDAGAAPLTHLRSVVIVSDWVEHLPESMVDTLLRYPDDQPWTPPAQGVVDVAGGYLERLPLALIAAGRFDRAEIWHHVRGPGVVPIRRDSAVLARRGFRIEEGQSDASAGMEGFVRAHGAPHILVVLGLGVSAALLDACKNSIIIYNSIDAPALRVPPEVSARFDLVLTGARWQSEAVEALHPGMPTIVLPIGPEFAAIDQFRPLNTPKDLDLIYVAAAQPYKRHDILFDALAGLPRDVRALCVFGYGEMADDLRRHAAELQLSVDFVGPPGVPIDEVNRLMNRAKFGVVCGIDDGEPAILTEYMLAGLPVLANSDLTCGLQFISPETGISADGDRFAEAIMTLRETAAAYSPRQFALDRWSWPHSVARLTKMIDTLRHPVRISSTRLAELSVV